MKPEETKGYAAVNGSRLYYESRGVGPALVLIHGYIPDARMWDDQMDSFSRDYRVIRYDLRGFGKSDVPTRRPYSHFEDLNALLDYLNVDKAHILGLSLGGAIAVDFALAYPARTSSLIPVDTSALGGYPWPERLNAWFEPIYAAAGAGDLGLAKERWLNTGWFTPARQNPEVASRLRKMADEYSGWDWINENPLLGLNPPANARLEEIGAPTLVALGELDLPFYNRAIADALANRIPRARKVVIPKAGHMANLERPAEFNQAVLSFLSGLT